jgi:hypothetical protein
MVKHHGGTHHVQGVIHKGTERKPSPYHGGSGAPKGVVHEAPARPAVNDQNYAGQKLKRK